MTPFIGGRSRMDQCPVQEQLRNQRARRHPGPHGLRVPAGKVAGLLQREYTHESRVLDGGHVRFVGFFLAG